MPDKNLIGRMDVLHFWGCGVFAVSTWAYIKVGTPFLSHMGASSTAGDADFMEKMGLMELNGKRFVSS